MASSLLISNWILKSYSWSLVHQVCWILVWLNPNKPIPQNWSPSPSKTQTFPSRPTQPQNFVFLGITPLFLVQDPLGGPLPSLPASLSLSEFYLGAARAPLLKLLLKREHIQWGLSHSLSVSIKDPGNTTLSTLKGPAGPKSSQPESQHLQSCPWEANKTGIYTANQLFTNGMWTPDRECQHHPAINLPKAPRCCLHLMGVSSNIIYLDYSWWCITLCRRNMSAFFKQIPWHCRDTTEVME